MKTQNFDVDFKNTSQSRRLSLFLKSQSLKDDSKEAIALLTDNISLAKRSEMPVVLVMSPEDVPEVERLIGVVSKPFSFEYLSVYLRAIAKRLHFCSYAKRTEFNGLEIDRAAHEVFYRQALIRLPLMEFKIVDCLAARRGDIVPLSEISQEVWGYESSAAIQNVRNIRSHIKNLRKQGIPIKTIHNEGYAICSESFGGSKQS